VFVDSLGGPTADDIWALAKQRTHGISRTEVRDLLNRNKKAREIDRAPTALVDAGRPQRHKGHDRTGQPAESWIPLNGPLDRDFGRFGRTSPALQPSRPITPVDHI